MIKLQLKDNEVKEYKKGITVYELASSISLSLAKNTVGALLDDKKLGLEDPIYESGKLQLLTKQDQKSLDLLNHSGAHLLALAIQRLYPNAKFWVGPAIENGFYYDIDFMDEKFSTEDLEKVEKEMKKAVKQSLKIEREEVDYENAKEVFKDNPYKLDLIEQHKDEILTLYKEGDFVDLCRGGHISNTRLLEHFKLLSVAGAYYKGDSNNKVLTRIYGTVFWTKEDLDKHLNLLKERKERDHRKLGKELELFFTSDLVGQGLPFLMPKGSTIRRIIERYIIDKELELGYEHVYTPVLANVDLYKTSGHWDHYQDGMFPKMDLGDGEMLVLRPMNCPHHIQIFSQKLRSYRDLPLKVAELGMMHRYEKSGGLSGLQRVREMTLNDGHIFVSLDLIKQEFKETVQLILEAYKDFRITDYSFRLSYRDKEDKVKYFDDDQMWDNAEKMLKETMDELGYPYYEAKGEAAFYGPKLDVQIKTALGHSETLSTIQLDFLLPRKFDIKYKEKDGTFQTPIMIHRGVVSTMERFIAYLIEEYKGAFPLWLSPYQLCLMPVNNDYHLEYTKKLNQLFRKQGFRTVLDDSDQKLGYKIRQHQTEKINYLIVIGDNEVNNNLITYRKYGENEQTTLPVDDFIKLLQEEVNNKGR